MDRNDVLMKQTLLLWTVTVCLTTVAISASVGQETTPLVDLNVTIAPPGSRRINVTPVTTKPVGGQVTCLDECRCSLSEPATRSEGVKLSCESDVTMTSFPVLAKEHNMSRIREIYISYQPKLEQINSSSLVHYPSLEKLTIEYSGLQNISPETFKNNEKLKTIILRENKLTVVSWALFDGITELSIEGNPIVCGCDAMWLINPREIFKDAIIRRPDKCFSGEERRSLKDLTWHDCELPKVDVLQKSIRANVSDRVEFVCGGRGSPEPRVYWMPWWEEGDYEVKVSDDRQTTTLTLANATPEHSGEIICSADNVVGRAQASTKLYVLSAPKILTLEVQEGFNWNIVYVISGLPVPNVTWYRDSLPLLLNNLISDKSVTVEPAYWSRRGCLTFFVTNHMNNGNYTLVADNEFGSAAKTVSAVFLNSPDSVFRKLPVVSDRTVDGEDEDASTSKRPGGLNRYGGGPYRNGSQSAEDKYDNTVIILVVAASSACAVILIVSMICCLIFHQRKRRTAFQKNLCFRSLCPERNRNSVYCDTIAREMIPLNSARIVDNPNYFKQDPTIPQAKVVIPRIPPQNIQVLRDLGEGAFGRVVLGTCKLSEPEGDRLTLVAIKTLKDSHTEDAKKDFEREAELLTSLQHENIVRPYGISEDGDTRMIIFEYMENGDLNNFLRSHGPDARFFGKGIQAKKPSLRMRDLLHISNQIAAGAEYLSRKHFVHRDLATRNCLVGEKLTVKIGDFGMSRDVYSADYYKVGGQTMLPIRWMPYESIIYRTFTMESDVWSFGVVLWEIFSFGKQPWYELTNTEVIQHLEMGKVLDCPVGGHCPDEVYRLMLGCWRKHPEDRLTMSQLHVHLTRLLQYFSNDPAASSTQDYMAKHVSYLEILSDDAA